MSPGRAAQRRSLIWLLVKQTLGLLHVASNKIASPLSPLTLIAERFFRVLQYLPPQVFWPSRSDLSTEEIASSGPTTRRAKRIDYLVIGYCLVELIAIVALSLVSPLRLGVRLVVRAAAVLRVVDIVQVTVNLTVFDASRGRSDNLTASMPRLVVLAFVNFIELILCFALIYSSDLSRLHNASGVGDAVYFSAITQLTIGYGDITPLGWLRWAVVSQGIAGLVFVVLVFARVLSNLPALREPTKG